MKRRTWILSALGAASALVVGWGVMPQRSRLGSAVLLAVTSGEVAFNGWKLIWPLLAPVLQTHWAEQRLSSTKTE